MALVGPDWRLAWLVPPFWLVAGCSMGLAYPSISVLSLDHAAPCDGGVMLTTFASAAHPSAAIVRLDLLLAGLAPLGALTPRPARASS